MTYASMLGFAEYETESAFGEDVNNSAPTRLPILDAIDVSGLTKSKTDSARVVQYRGEYTMPIRGVKGGSFTIRLWLTGHGSSTSGATSMTALGTLLGNVIGNGAVVAASGTTANGAGADADTITTTASGTFTPGGVCFIGSLGDGDGNGQAYAIASHTTTTMELATGLDGAVANSAVIYSAENIYPDCDYNATLTPTRWTLGTADQVYQCHGCTPASISYSTAMGEPPSVTITFNVAWWEEMGSGFPSATSVTSFVPAPLAGGSLFIQAFGTSTRAKYSFRSISISHELGIITKPGPGGVVTDQLIVDAIRGHGDTVRVTFTVDSEAASLSPVWPVRWDSDSQFYHAMFTFNAAASVQRTALYLRYAMLVGDRPVQKTLNGINVFEITLQASTLASGSTDILQSAYVWALG